MDENGGRDRLAERDRERDAGEGYEAADSPRPGPDDPLSDARMEATDEERPEERPTPGMSPANAEWEIQKQFAEDRPPHGQTTSSKPLSADELPDQPNSTQG